MTSESVIRRTKFLALAVALALAAPTAFAESGITNIINGVTNNYASGYTVGTDGSLNGLILTNAGGLIVTGDSAIGNSSLSSSNSAWVTGTSSVWNCSGTLYVGNTGSFNSLSIANGGQVFSSYGFIGSSSGANSNTVLVTGAGSLWEQSYLLIGNSGSFNRLTISNGAMVLSHLVSIGASSNSSGNIVIVTGAGSIWNNNYGSYYTSLFVGKNSSGNQMTIANGGLVINNEGDIGLNWTLPTPGNSNAVLVTGTGSIWTNENILNIGNGGSLNQLTISNGAKVVVSFGSYIGCKTTDNSNTVMVTGPGSVWSNIEGDLQVGGNGSFNQLTIANSGAVYNLAGYIGYGSSSYSNSVTVTGAGSLWTNSIIYVGYAGTKSSLTIADGGHVFSTNSYIGYSSRDSAVLVTDAGSLWNNSRSIYIGLADGYNILTISNAGTVTATNVLLGNGANGYITISGGNLYVTNSTGTGVLNVPWGRVTLNSGTVIVNRLYLTNRTSCVFVFNGGMLESGGTTVSNTVPFVVGNGLLSATYDMLGGIHSFANGLLITPTPRSWATARSSAASPISARGCSPPA